MVWIILGICLLLLGGLVPMLVITWRIADHEYNDKFLRIPKEKWGRECSAPEIEEHLDMFNRGVAWGDAHMEAMRPVEVQSDGLRLAGQYFDFGRDRAVIILPGRAESCVYSYYFAPAYEKAGYNILVVDVRAHGWSGGTSIGFGIKETADLRAWLELLRGELGMQSIVIHGVCVGGSTAVMTAAKPDFPGEVKAIVTEGLFLSFYETFKQRTRNGGHPVIPVAWEVWLMAKMRQGVDIARQCPLRSLPKMHTPILFIQGKEDISSLPKNAPVLLDACGAQVKEIAWLEHGAHSHLRIRNEEAYDTLIADFLARL